MLPVVLIGGIHHNMLGVVRALGERGVPKDFLYVIIIGQIFQIFLYVKHFVTLAFY